MIWWVVILGLAAVASCPILFAGWWTKRWFRMSCYVAALLIIGIAFRTGAPPH